MSSISRIVAVGLPAVGLSAALALGVSPALASEATMDQGLRPVVAATGYGDEEPDATDDAPTRGQGGYGTPGTTTPDVDDTDTATPATTPDVDDTDTPDTDTPTRGNPGYGPTPTASVDTVTPSATPSTPTGALPATSPPGGGVSAGGALPVTGAPTGMVISLGAVLVAAGAGAVWYTRRRRTA
ncbi:LPXTG cell wall anchor domain-containing protein [Actinoplanes sp. TRM 88003]|uniref:LPXTG cell wall anchor domain-containing protein n=1 Tax=Paractinoplanes aksuensis TaxID=2939490 RepID=A0ABT1DJ39_9ACTN|nr:LPXTG cell wall anchor domain-containing protein [Actinoplanes aksuensis]MCO8270852.1 LPXTG cell wall anchor domain-containing protein [Actinoplanes aksuensis]